MMKKSLALAALVAALAAARLNADDSCREVRIPFDGEQAKHVTFYEALDESGRVLFFSLDEPAARIRERSSDPYWTIDDLGFLTPDMVREELHVEDQR